MKNESKTKKELLPDVKKTRTSGTEERIRECRAALGRLASGAAHEIRNPLHIMSLNLQMLEMTEGLSEKTREALSVCNAQIERIVNIVEGLRSFSQIPVSRPAINDFNAVIENILADTAAHFEREGIRVEQQYDRGLPSLPADAEGIRTVMKHLLTNAIEAMKGEEKKVLKIRTQMIDSKEAAAIVRMTLSDSGHGISEENISKIFNPFFTTKVPDKGLGLGLFIAYGIIQDHSGTIRAENNETGGASFIIELPVARGF
jgi:signal transduction histidine kinase